MSGKSSRHAVLLSELLEDGEDAPLPDRRVDRERTSDRQLQGEYSEKAVGRRRSIAKSFDPEDGFDSEDAFDPEDAFDSGSFDPADPFLTEDALDFEDEGGHDRSKKPSRREKSDAFEAAMAVLAKGDNSRRMLREKLGRKGYPESEIHRAIERLGELGYVDDRRLLLRTAGQLCDHRHYGAFRVKMTLLRYFDRSVVEEYFDLAVKELDFSAAAAAEVEKWSPKGEDFLRRRLERLGFAASEIRRAISDR